MVVDHVSVPYQFDVTYIDPVVNLLINKMQELASDQMVSLTIKPYINIDLAKVTEIFNVIADAQRNLCVQIGVDTDLASVKYQNIDYNGIIAAMGDLGYSLNNIIDAAQKNMQSDPSHGWN